MKPCIMILHTAGANRDGEAAAACELAGGAPEIVHMNQLRRGARRFDDFQMLLLPGGFTYGDALGAGTRLALDMQLFFHGELHAFVDSGRPVLGICNGFQTLVKAGLLPGEAQARTALDEMACRRVTLAENAGGRFECRWVHLLPNRRAASPFVAALDEIIFCPIAHGEGNVQVCDDATLAALDEQNLIAFHYVDAAGNPAQGRYPLNPNGSVGDIAGLCSAAGNVVGLMPHPEDHIRPVQSPLGRGGLGLALFQSIIRAIA